MDLGLAQRVAVCLASSAGLGRSAAEALLAEGARVALSGRDPERLEATLAELSGPHGERVFGEAFDVLDDAALAGHFRKVRERFGPVEVLVVNAGGPRPGSAAELAPDDLEAAYRLTLRSAVAAIHEVLPEMRARSFGRIVAMTSSTVRQPMPGMALSNTMRAGLTGFLKTLAGEVAAEGVTVNSICTGMFDTERLRDLFEVRAARSGRTAEEERAAAVAAIPAGRIGDPHEFGAWVAFLASAQASFLTGVALPFDGGASRHLL